MHVPYNAHFACIRYTVCLHGCRYTFWTENYDIKFSIYRKNASSGGRLDEVLTPRKYNSHAVPEDGSVKCDSPATCKCDSPATCKCDSPATCKCHSPATCKCDSPATCKKLCCLCVLVCVLCCDHSS